MERLQTVQLGFYHPGNVSRSSMACIVSLVLQECFLMERYMKALLASLFSLAPAARSFSQYIEHDLAGLHPALRLDSFHQFTFLPQLYSSYFIHIHLKINGKTKHPKTEFHISDPMCAFFSSECEQAILTDMSSVIDLLVFSNPAFFLWRNSNHSSHLHDLYHILHIYYFII